MAGLSRSGVLPAGVLFLSLVLASGAFAQAPRDAPRRVASAAGFSTPESVRYDLEQDVYFVTSIVGNPSAKDGAGFVSRLRPDGTVESLRWIEGGRGGATLNAPKGMALSGDTLWVADVDAVRAFHRRTGAPLATVELGALGAAFLNDVARGPDGALYVTDTGIAIDAQGAAKPVAPGRVFRLDGAGARVVLQGDALAMPNGIAADPAGGFLLAPAGGPAVQRWTPGEAAPRAVAEGPGSWDGVEVLPDGRVLVSSWADGAVHELRDGSLRPLVQGVKSPADLGVDTRRGRVAVPLFTEDRVEIWTIPGGSR
ncbi:MAG TPA: SMP-30/gluconolactonase/LRE family protein [Longimicrobiaceae bacterium]|nr:SMP-30/gluconolactonase/LRE family protein [Longimicrobiaceae bacterium]